VELLQSSEIPSKQLLNTSLVFLELTLARQTANTKVLGFGPGLFFESGLDLDSQFLHDLTDSTLVVGCYCNK